MFPAERTIRHIAEAHWVRQALGGDTLAANRIFEQISSMKTSVRQVMVETFHDIADLHLCLHLLQCLSLHRLDERRDCDLRSDPEASERIDQTLIDFFINDEADLEKAAKEAVLMEALNDAEPQVRHAAAVLLGLRRDERAIPVLAESVKTGKTVWKLRAIRALGLLQDIRCAEPLVAALSIDREEIHRAALEALKGLGELGEAAWKSALQHSDPHIRWQAARSLSELGDPRGLETLAEGLLDENADVHWASAEGLAHLGRVAIPAILAVLERKKLAGSSRQAAYSALQRLTAREDQTAFKPLLDALSSPSSSVEVPSLAKQAREMLAQPV